MSAEFPVGRSPDFVARARKLARVLDDRFDAFGELIADEALDYAAVILDAIETAGCKLVFADEPNFDQSGAAS